MKILSTARYNELLEYEKKVKQASNEVQRKEFVINEKVAIDNRIEIYFEMACFSQTTKNLQKVIWFI